MTQKSTNKEEQIESPSKIMEVLEFLNKIQPNLTTLDELYKHFEPSLISSMIDRNFLEVVHTSRTVGLTSMGFNFLIQQKTNENLEKLNASVVMLNKSSDGLIILTIILIALAGMPFVKGFDLIILIIAIIILIFLVIPFLKGIGSHMEVNKNK